MSAFKDEVYWRDQCDFCIHRLFCKYRDAAELLLARLKVVDMETRGCYGTISFWCDYFEVDEGAVNESRKHDCCEEVSE